MFQYGAIHVPHIVQTDDFTYFQIVFEYIEHFILWNYLR